MDSLRSIFRLRFAALLLLFGLMWGQSAGAYSVLSHEEVVDMAWEPQIVPLLKARFPGISDDAIRHAHAYAYGGSVIQDIGYYPFGSHYFSDLLHYVRTGDFVGALIRDSTTPDEYGFALGALAHYCGDTVGHPYINRVTAKEYPKLERRFGQSVTYEEEPTAHLRTEFGFDVVGVARGFYSQEGYRDFIGFQVAKPLLERAFNETYGLQVSEVMKEEDLAISTYRYSVSKLIPHMTKVALASYHDQIEAAHPGFDRNKFLYRFERTEFQTTYGAKYQKPGILARFFALLIAITPKVGPLKALRLSVPTGDEQTIYLRSLNETVDRYKVLLAEVQASPTPLPADEIAAVNPKTAQAASAAEPSASGAGSGAALTKKNDKDDAVEGADKATQKSVDKATQKSVDKATQKSVDKAVKLTDKDVAQSVEQTMKDAPGAGKPTVSLVHADAAAASGVVGSAAAAQPIPPKLPDLDMDTGRPTLEGEYRLADQAYAHLLSDLTRAKTQTITPGLRRYVLDFYANDAASDDKLKLKPAEWRKVQANLATFRAHPAQLAQPAVTASPGTSGAQ